MSAGTAFEQPFSQNSGSSYEKRLHLLMDDTSVFDLGGHDAIDVVHAKSTNYEYSLPENNSLNSEITKADLRDNAIVGLLDLPMQSQRFSKQKGGAFNLMITGQKGTGKSTFVNTLFATNFEDSQETDPMASVRVAHYRLVEEGYPLDLCLIDTPNYGSDIDNAGIWLTLSQFIDEQLKIYLFRENQPFRKTTKDTRIHCCIYFLSAATGITQLDIETMSHLYTRVNLIPVIGKSDCLSRGELNNFKLKAQNVLDSSGIKICDFLADEELKQKITTMIPFSVVGSNTFYHNNAGDLVRGRQYDWGLIEVENEEHCDFAVLRDILMSKNMLDFIQSTESHYEKFRRFFLEKAVSAFAHGPISGGLDELKLYHKLTLQNYRQHIKMESPSLQFVMDKARDNFENEVKDQENRFREWKKALVSKQRAFNDEIQRLHRIYLKLAENHTVNVDSFFRDPGSLEMESFSAQEEYMLM